MHLRAALAAVLLAFAAPPAPAQGLSAAAQAQKFEGLARTPPMVFTPDPM